MQKYCVGFVFGGRSAEREVSCVTMLQVKRLVEATSVFDPHYFYLDEETGDFLCITSKDMIASNFVSKEAILKVSTRVEFARGGDVIKRGKMIYKKLFSLDAIVNCCHGGCGENGELAGFFEILSIPFSTFSHTYLGLSMDKHLFKCLLKSQGIMVPSWVYFTAEDYKRDFDILREKVKKLGFPVIVKPNASGSSLGINVANDLAELDEAIAVALKFDSSVIIEKLVTNKIEFNCAVVSSKKGNFASDVDQIETSKNVFNFEDKYIGNRQSDNKENISIKEKDGAFGGAKKTCGMEYASRLLPAPIGEDLTRKIQETALEVFGLIHGSGVARVDFLYDSKRKKLYVGEVNAVPGSMALYFFARTKFDGLSLLLELVENAILNHNKKIKQSKIDDKFIPKIF